MPAVAARAAVAAAATNDLPNDLRWLVGDIHLIQLADVVEAVRRLGAGEFVTFEDPVVEWSGNSFGLKASFTLSPTTMVLLVEPAVPLSPENVLGAVCRHALAALPYRQTLICRTEPTGALLEAAGRLVPSF